VAATKWLADDEMKAWRSFITTTLDLLRTIEKDLEPFGLDFGDYQLLVMLSEAPEHRLKLSDLASTLRLSRSGLTRRMEGVVATKLVNRERDAADGRATYAVLTTKGLSLLKRAAPSHVASVRTHMIDLLTTAEIKAIGTAFTKIARNLDSD
jgi:DNA-binding MarR family transcriptional regulator